MTPVSLLDNDMINTLSEELKSPVRQIDRDIQVKRDAFKESYAPKIRRFAWLHMGALPLTLSEFDREMLEDMVIEEVAARIVGRKSNEKKFEGRHRGKLVIIDPLKERRKDIIERMGDANLIESEIDKTATTIQKMYDSTSYTFKGLD